MFILIRLTQHVSGIIMPIVRRTDYVKTACGLCLVVLAAVVQSLGQELCALCESCSRIPTFKQCTQLVSQLCTTAANTTRHTPHAVFT